MSGLWKWNKKERYKIICDITEKEFPLNNVHTEGMNRYQHPEFQVILKLPPALIHYLLKELMKKVADGKQFQSGDLVEDLLPHVPIRLDTYQMYGPEVLRVIIPDKRGRFPEDEKCDFWFKLQAAHIFEKE